VSGDAARIGALLLPTSDGDREALLALERLSEERPLGWEALTAEASGADGCMLVARDHAGTVVGFASARLLVDVAHVVRLVVTPSRRRHGIGSDLLAGLIHWARGVGAESLTLEVRASNVGAVGLYERLGLVEAGRRPRYYHDGEDALLLTLPLVAVPGGE